MSASGTPEPPSSPRWGSPDPSEERRAFYFDREPNFSIHYAADSTVELVEVCHAQGRDEAFLGDAQLTYRLMDDVKADLERARLVGRPVDMGLEYDAGSPFGRWRRSAPVA